MIVAKVFMAGLLAFQPAFDDGHAKYLDVLFVDGRNPDEAGIQAHHPLIAARARGGDWKTRYINPRERISFRWIAAGENPVPDQPFVCDHCRPVSNLTCPVSKEDAARPYWLLFTQHLAGRADALRPECLAMQPSCDSALAGLRIEEGTFRTCSLVHYSGQVATISGPRAPRAAAEVMWVEMKRSEQIVKGIEIRIGSETWLEIEDPEIEIVVQNSPNKTERTATATHYVLFGRISTPGRLPLPRVAGFCTDSDQPDCEYPVGFGLLNPGDRPICPPLGG